MSKSLNVQSDNGERNIVKSSKEKKKLKVKKRVRLKFMDMEENEVKVKVDRGLLKILASVRDLYLDSGELTMDVVDAFKGKNKFRDQELACLLLEREELEETMKNVEEEMKSHGEETSEYVGLKYFLKLMGEVKKREDSVI